MVGLLNTSDQKPILSIYQPKECLICII